MYQVNTSETSSRAAVSARGGSSFHKTCGAPTLYPSTRTKETRPTVAIIAASRSQALPSENSINSLGGCLLYHSAVYILGDLLSTCVFIPEVSAREVQGAGETTVY